MPSKEKMTLKAFWEAVEQRLDQCSADELRAILRAMAHETLPAGRQAFLAKLEPAAETGSAIQQAIGQEDLLADIGDLAREIKAAMKNAEEYWDEGYYDEWGDYHDDEDSLSPYEDFVEPLAALVERVDAVFDYGKLTLARKAYQKLYETLSLEDDHGRGVRISDLDQVDKAELWARYLRAVYETEPQASRPQALFEQMQQSRFGFGKPRAMLDDVIQISPKPLPDQDQFLKEWVAFLRKQKGADADAWLREAIRLSQGTAGLEKLALKEGKKRPRAYLDWFTALESEGKHAEVLAAAQQALLILPEKQPIRAAVADHLCVAASKLNDPQALRDGRWQAFEAQPGLGCLLDLQDTVAAGKEQLKWMRQAAEYLKDYIAHPPRKANSASAEWPPDDQEEEAWTDESVLVHAYLLAQDWDAAHKQVAHMQVLGWSYDTSSQGWCLAFFLALLAGCTDATMPANLKELWRSALRSSIGFGYGGMAYYNDYDDYEDKEGWVEADALASQDNRLPERIEHTYAQMLPNASLSKEQQTRFSAWCIDTANKRMQAIVGGQHRKSYDKAAVLVAACAEMLQAQGKDADAMLNSARESFPRHSAFQAELERAAGRMGRARTKKRK